jgi:hypothetical protein
MTEPLSAGARDILLVVDIQYDFCPGGALAVPRGDEVIAPINRGWRGASSTWPGRKQVWRPYGPDNRMCGDVIPTEEDQ